MNETEQMIADGWESYKKAVPAAVVGDRPYMQDIKAAWMLGYSFAKLGKCFGEKEVKFKNIGLDPNLEE
jgi:hypothetical protein